MCVGHYVPLSSMERTRVGKIHLKLIIMSRYVNNTIYVPVMRIKYYVELCPGLKFCAVLITF